MKKKWVKLILVILVFGIILAYLSQRSVDDQSTTRTTATSQPQVTLSVQPQRGNLKAGEEVNVAVLANSPNGVLAIDLDLSFNPKILSIKKITPGNFFTEPMVFYQKTDLKKGTILYSLGSLKPSNNQETLINITFMVKKDGVTNQLVSFGPKTLAAVKGAREAQIVVQ